MQIKVEKKITIISRPVIISYGTRRAKAFEFYCTDSSVKIIVKFGFEKFGFGC